MTFCLGMRLKDGLVGISDSRVTMGTECITARKVKTFKRDGGSWFMMTSGLRSIRDKALTYYEDFLATTDQDLDRMYKVVNAFGNEIRRVSNEDRDFLSRSGLYFDLHTLMGGQLKNDPEPRLYLIYPQGNWVEIEPGTPYHIIGERNYGKPILDRTVKYSDSMEYAFKVGCLAFDSTRISAADVDFPLDVLLYRKDSFHVVEHRYQKEDLQEISNWWQERLRQSINDLPSDFIARVFSKLEDGPA